METCRDVSSRQVAGDTNVTSLVSTLGRENERAVSTCAERCCVSRPSQLLVRHRSRSAYNPGAIQERQRLNQRFHGVSSGSVAPGAADSTPASSEGLSQPLVSVDRCRRNHLDIALLDCSAIAATETEQPRRKVRGPRSCHSRSRSSYPGGAVSVADRCLLHEPFSTRPDRDWLVCPFPERSPDPGRAAARGARACSKRISR